MSVVHWRPQFIPLLLAALVSACDDPDPLAPSFAVSKGGPSVGAPTNLTATAASYRQIWLAWQDNATNENGFEVWRSTTGPTGTFTLFTTYPWPNIIAGGNDGLQASTEYCYEVRAFKGTRRPVSYSAFSNVACATTLAPPVPAAPSNLSAAPNGWGIGVTWIDNAGDETGFRLERSAMSSGPWSSLGNLYPNVVSFQDRNPPAGEQPACYRAFAFNGFGDSGPSNVDCTAVPNSPDNLVATVNVDGSVDLTWSDNSAVEDGYQVQRGDPNAIDVHVVATLPANTTSFHDAGLPDGAYGYNVRATKDGGESGTSFWVTVVVATMPPAAPSDAIAFPSSSSSISILWSDNSATEAGFRVERSSDDGASWVAVGTAGPDATAFGDWGLPGEQRVCYRVIAFNNAGDSPASNTACTTPPAAPTGLMATPAEAGAIHLSWTDNSSAEDGYSVRRLTLLTYCDDYGCYDYYDYVEIATAGPNATSYHDSGLNSGESYTYVVVALKGYGQSDYSNEASATAP